MVVGVCRIVLSLPGNSSLKGKRAVVKRICERSKQRFGVAAAEVASLDVHERAVLAFSVVSNDERHVESVLSKLLDFVSGATEAVVVQEQTQRWRPVFEDGAWPEDDLARWEAAHAEDEDDEWT